MRKSAVSSSFWAFRRWVWASGGITSRSALFTFCPTSAASSIRRSVSPLTSCSLPKPYTQFTGFDGRAQRAPRSQHPGQRDLPAIAAHRHEELTVLTGKGNVLPVGEWHLQSQDVLRTDLLDTL